MLSNPNEPEAVNERHLWKEFQEGNKQAFSVLMQKYANPLFVFAYRFCNDKDIVKDCLQEMYADLWDRRTHLSVPTSVKWYLFKVIRNRVLREQVKWNKLTSVHDDYDFILDFSIEDKLILHTEDKELAVKVQKALNTLSPRKREIVYLRYYEDLDFEQIAQIMNLSRQSVHNLLQKAYNSIRLEWPVLLSFLAFLPRK